MPIDPKRPDGLPGIEGRLLQGLSLDGKMLYRLTLLCRQIADGGAEYLGMINLPHGFFGISGRIGMIFISERCINFACPCSSTSAQPIDRAPLRDGSEPRRKRAARIVSLPRLVDAQQSVLHNIV